jgi:hypothetical protein
MDWPLILHFERAAFFVLLVVIGCILSRRLLRGDEVDQVGAGPANLKFAEATADPLKALRDAVDEGVRDLDRRVLRVERDLARATQPKAGTEPPKTADS